MANLENLINARGVMPIALSQMVNPGLGPECGWCGWTPPQDDVLGALAYCTQRGLACPSCRMTEWNCQEDESSAEDVLRDALERGAGAVLAVQYMFSWARHRGLVLPPRAEMLALMRRARVEAERRAEDHARRIEQILAPKKEYFVHIRDVNKMFYFTPAKPYEFWAGLMRQVNLPARNPRKDGFPIYVVSLSTCHERELGEENFDLKWISNGGYWYYEVLAYGLQDRWGGGTFREYEKGHHI